MKENVTFSDYGKSFQETLTQLIFEDRGFSEQMEEVLDINFFELKYLQEFTRLVFNYRHKYGVHPSEDIMSSILRTELDEESDLVKKQIRDYYARSIASKVQDIEYIKETALDFCKKQKLKEAMLKSVSLLQRSSFGEIKTIIDEALKLGTDSNCGHDYKLDFEERYIDQPRNPISTGWWEIDKITKGGLGKGELGVGVAATGAGKSMALVHLGASALKAGMNVVHYTLELSEPVVGLRYDSCLSGVPIGDLKQYKDMVHETCSDVEGNLIIKEYPTKSASPNTIRAHLAKVTKRNPNIDMIIVDYGDLLKPTSSFREKRNELESIYEELRGIAQEYECPLWTVSQTNRSGLNTEIITMESISEAFSKCFVADFIFSLSRTIKHKNENSGRVFVAKNRNGPDGLVYPIFMDTANVRINVLPQTDETVESINNQSLLDQQKSLKEKYKKHRSQK
jgi:replicative DNA helicase